MAKFKPGQSGNEAGRPPKIATAQALRDILMPDMPEIIAVLKEQAKSGDQGAAKLLLDRCYPAIKPQALPVLVPAGSDLSETGHNILGSTLSGGISPDIGAMLIAALANQAKIIEITELAKRVEQLESQTNG